MRIPHKTKAEKEGEVDRVYRLLKTWLLDCRLSPGELLSEVELARQCNTSRTPVREACNRLAQDGWITRIRQKGYMVTPVSVRDVLQLYEYRKLLECFTVEKAAQVASPEQIARLARIIKVEERGEVEISEVVAANDSFHLGIAELAGNQLVFDQLKLTLEYVHRLDTLSTQKSHAWIPHGEILSALQTPKPNEARQAMAAHIFFLFTLTGVPIATWGTARGRKPPRGIFLGDPSAEQCGYTVTWNAVITCGGAVASTTIEGMRGRRIATTTNRTNRIKTWGSGWPGDVEQA